MTLLGTFSLHDGGSVPTTPVRRRLLAYLALREKPVARQTAAEALWPDVPDDRAGARLRTTLWRLTGHDLVRSHGDTLALAPSVRVDLHEARQRAHHLDARTGPELFEHDLLPDWPDDWLLVDRQSFHELRLRALERLSELWLHEGRPVSAWAAASAVVCAEPLRESGHRQLLRLHEAEGNVAAALRHFEEYRRRLFAELQVGVSPSLQDFVERLRARHRCRW